MFKIVFSQGKAAKAPPTPQPISERQQQEVGIAADSIELAKIRAQLAAAVAARDKQLATQEEDTQRIGGVVLCAHVGLAKTVYIPRIFGEFSTE